MSGGSPQAVQTERSVRSRDLRAWIIFLIILKMQNKTAKYFGALSSRLLPSLSVRSRSTLRSTLRSTASNARQVFNFNTATITGLLPLLVLTRAANRGWLVEQNLENLNLSMLFPHTARIPMYLHHHCLNVYTNVWGNEQ